MARITFVFNDRLLAEIRKVQAKQLLTSKKSVSLSSVLNQVIAKGMGVKL